MGSKAREGSQAIAHLSLYPATRPRTPPPGSAPRPVAPHPTPSPGRPQAHVVWRATRGSDIEIAGNCFTNFTLQNVCCWSTSSCGDSCECPALRNSVTSRKVVGEGDSTPVSSCDSNPMPTHHQQTWRIRTTPEVSTSQMV